MTLPASPPISWLDICTEFGLTPTTAVWPTSFYGLGGAPSSGALSFADFLGRSNGPTYSPAPGSYTNEGLPTGTLTLTASQSVVWTYTQTSGVSGTVTDQNGAAFASGGSATSIKFTVTGTTNTSHSSTWSVSSGGKSWTITCIGDQTNGGGTCVATSSFILMASGRAKLARAVKVGDLVWTRHEKTRRWGVHRVTAISFHDDEVYSVPGYPLATYRHRFALPFFGWWRAGWIGRKVGKETIAKITVEDAHTYMAKRPGGRWKLSHNIKS